MELIYKEMARAGGRGMYMRFPKGEPRALRRVSALIVLRDSDTVRSAEELMAREHLAELSDQRNVILAFPNPVNGRWNWEENTKLPDDLAFLEHLQGELNSPVENEPFSMARAASSNPLNDERFHRLWHPMADVRYFAGFGTGASMVCRLAAIRPQWTAAIFAQGGDAAALCDATCAPVPAYLAGCPEETEEYFFRANGVSQEDGTGEYHHPLNPGQQVTVVSPENRATLAEVYNSLFSRVRRVNTSLCGDVEARMPDADGNFTFYANDTRLGDGAAHTWITHVPERVKEHPDVRVPLMIFFHGASDNPLEAADMTKFHVLGEREGFITVYPWGGNRMTWNSGLNADEPDDGAYIAALIRYMVANDPVDPQRVYLSGFSNGAGEVQAVALSYPELIAAICPIDANWPGNRMGESDLTWRDVTPMRVGMEKKRTFDYRMPVWYTYGGRELSYPVYNRSTQQKQYDFWKMYNHIPIRPTLDKAHPHPCGCGVPGDSAEQLHPSETHPEHTYDVQRFNTEEPDRMNLYNYVVMLGKGHEIAPMDPELGWRYVSRFRRRADGSLRME